MPQRAASRSPVVCGRRLERAQTLLGKRPDGARLLADAAAGGVQTVIVYRVDLLGRGRKLLATLDELESAGVRYIISVTEARYDLCDPNDEVPPHHALWRLRL